MLDHGVVTFFVICKFEVLLGNLYLLIQGPTNTSLESSDRSLHLQIFDFTVSHFSFIGNPISAH